MYKYDPIQADENTWLYRGFILRRSTSKWEAIPSLYPVEYVMFSAAQGWVHTVMNEIDRYWKNAREAKTNILRDVRALYT